jgi:hypothetical protein
VTKKSKLKKKFARWSNHVKPSNGGGDERGEGR